MAEKLSKFALVKELQIYTTWTLASFQISIPVYVLGAIFGEERFETEANAKGKSFRKKLHLKCIKAWPTKLFCIFLFERKRLFNVHET